MSYENYSFVLYWEDLPEDFREQKIEEVMRKWEITDPEGVKEMTEEELRERVEDFIKDHFPVYF